jgi:hypothetical protein
MTQLASSFGISGQVRGSDMISRVHDREEAHPFSPSAANARSSMLICCQ